MEILYRAYGDWFASAVKRRFGAERGEDLEQETWLRIAPLMAQPIRYPKALLMRIASNAAIDHARRGSSQLAAEDISGRDQPNAASQDEVILIKQIILGLPEPLRDVFLLSRFGGLTNSQIAERLGISVKTVEKRMTKALAHCAAQLRL